MPEPTPSSATSAEGGATAPADSTNGGEPRWRRPLAIGLIILAGVVMLVSSLTVWAKRQALDTNNWVEVSSELLQDEAIRQALSVAVVDAAFAQTDVGAELRERLPPALRPLAGQLAATLQSGAVNVADQALARPRVQKAWEEINRIAHQSLIAAIDQEKGRNATGDVTLDLSPIVNQVRGRLGLGPSPRPDAAKFVVISSDKVKEVRTAVRLIRGLSVLLWILVAALLVAAFWLAEGWRRRALMITGWTTVTVALAILAFRRIAGQYVIDSLTGDSQTRDAGDAAWLIGTTLLRDQAQALLAIGVLMLIAAWIAGPSRWATATRRWLAPWFRRQPLAVYGAFVLLIVILLLLLPNGNGRQFIGTLILFVLMFAGLELLKRRTLEEFPPEEADAGPSPAAGVGGGGAA